MKNTEEIGKAKLEVLQELLEYFTKERDDMNHRRDIAVQYQHYHEAAQQDSIAVGLDKAVSKINLMQLRISEKTYGEVDTDE